MHGEKGRLSQVAEYHPSRRDGRVPEPASDGSGTAQGRNVRLGTDSRAVAFASMGSIDFAMKLLEDANVAVSPGRAFGETGEGFLRLALVEN